MKTKFCTANIKILVEAYCNEETIDLMNKPAILATSYLHFSLAKITEHHLYS